MTLRRHSTVVVGAGPYGLGMSHALSARGIDHIVLDRHPPGQSWRGRRWRSLRLLTPNWANGLPGAPYRGPDPDGFMAASDFADAVAGYRTHLDAEISTETDVMGVRSLADGFELSTTRGPVACRNLVVATGACAQAVLPPIAASLPKAVRQLTPSSYSDPSDLPEDTVIVVGASASGVQIAREIRSSGRQVVLAVGSHLRLLRTYRGRDIYWWLDAIGALDERFDEVDDLHRARRAPSPQLSGTYGAVDLPALHANGVELVGRLMEVRGSRALFSGGLSHQSVAADLKLKRLLERIDIHAAMAMHETVPEGSKRALPTLQAATPRLEIDLRSGEIKTVIWATGYRPSLGWLPRAAFDGRGRPAHTGGAVDAVPGLFLLGLPFLRRRRSGLISGIGPDCRDLADIISRRLATSRAA